MIEYGSIPMGLNLLFRFHGSPILRTLPLCCVGVGLYAGSIAIGIEETYFNKATVAHPYVLSVILASYSFMIIFRCNFSYGRYWEAWGHVFQMHSKMLDAATTSAAFHYQQTSRYELPRCLSSRGASSDIDGEEFSRRVRERRGRTAGEVQQQRFDGISRNTLDREPTVRYINQRPESPMRETIAPVFPSPFLQELAHLYSLLSAVALSTLRCDAEIAPMPLSRHVLGEGTNPWPPVDPEELMHDGNCWTLAYIFGCNRTERARVLYNAERPLGVITGVGRKEAAALARVRGNSAAVAVAHLWVQEFVAREFTSGGAFGGVAPPIVSRIFQYNSDCMLGYNQARKVATCPFPFPHAQLFTYFGAIAVIDVVVLVSSYVNSVYVGAPLVFLTLMALLGLQEVAREMERPFRNTPNDVPIVTLQAQFNEALLVIYAGHHPDSRAWWDEEEEEEMVEEVEIRTPVKVGKVLKARPQIDV